jgi:Holliday junction resolvasome RuvABC endonuclease subunit
MDINQQKSLTKGKGWKFVKDYGKAKKEQITTKVKNIVGGIKATPAAIKKTFKKD